MAEPIRPEQPNPIPGKTVYEIRVAYGEEQARILNDLAYLPQAANQVDVSMSAGEREALSLMKREEWEVRAMAIREAWAAQRREELKTRYIELDVERAEAVADRVEALEDYLEPDAIDQSAYVQGFQMSEPQLGAAFDGIASMESEGADDMVKLLFKIGREREMEMFIAHAIDVRPDFARHTPSLLRLQTTLTASSLGTSSRRWRKLLRRKSRSLMPVGSASLVTRTRSPGYWVR